MKIEVQARDNPKMQLQNQKTMSASNTEHLLYAVHCAGPVKYRDEWEMEDRDGREM